MENNWAPACGEDKKKKLIQQLNKICNRVEEEHEWVSEHHLAVHEHKVLEMQYDNEVPFVWQWCFLWFAAPTNLSEKIRSGVIAKDRIDKTIDHAFRRALESPFTSKSTPRECLLETIQAASYETGDGLLGWTWTCGKLVTFWLWVMIPGV